MIWQLNTTYLNCTVFSFELLRYFKNFKFSFKENLNQKEYVEMRLNQLQGVSADSYRTAPHESSQNSKFVIYILQTNELCDAHSDLRIGKETRPLYSKYLIEALKENFSELGPFLS